MKYMLTNHPPEWKYACKVVRDYYFETFHVKSIVSMWAQSFVGYDSVLKLVIVICIKTVI